MFGTPGPEPPATLDELARRLTSYRCETDTGVPVDPREIVIAAILGQVRAIITDERGIIVKATRKRRFFDAALREAIQAVELRCAWPGCNVAVRQCDLDHTTGWTHPGGGTRADNCSPFCGRHNRWKEHGYRVYRDDNGHWHTLRPDGSELAPTVPHQPSW
jgi:hypothetical protein